MWHEKIKKIKTHYRRNVGQTGFSLAGRCAFLMRKTPAYMFNDMRVSVRDAEGKSHALTRSSIEGWIRG